MGPGQIYGPNMKAIDTKIGKVLEVYDEMGKHFSHYQKLLGLSCPVECGRCCLSNDVSASLLEVFPLAKDLILNNLVDSIWDSLEQKSCAFYQQTSLDGKKGYCTRYETRPMICRYFAVFSQKDKLGALRMSICRTLKENYSEQAKVVSESPHPGLLLTTWDNRLNDIDPYYHSKIYPINMAIKKAIEYLYLYYQVPANSEEIIS